MKTQIFDVCDFEVIKNEEYIDIKMSKETEAALDLAGQVLRDGGTVVFPTETVYGLGGNTFDKKALLAIFEAKGRPADNPLISHIARARDLDLLASRISIKTIKLIDTFWPGPLTVILPKKPEVPDEVTAGLSTVAVRMPSDPVALEVIRRAGTPIAAPSANLSGRPSPTKGEHVEEDLDGRVDIILKGKDTEVGIESTVIDMSGEVPMILRPGVITKSQIEEIIGPVEMDAALMQKDFAGTPKAPGMKYTHYAPKADMTVIRGGSDEQKSQKIQELLKQNQNKKTAIIASKELSEYDKIVKDVYVFGSRNHPEEAARDFFSILRNCDSAGVEFIIAEALEGQDVAFAVMNRMLKSAGHNIIELE